MEDNNSAVVQGHDNVITLQQIAEAIRSLNRNVPDSLSRVEQEIFPLMLSLSDTARADAFRMVKRHFNLLSKDITHLEGRFERFRTKSWYKSLEERERAAMTPELLEHAMGRLKSPQFFELLASDLETLGLVGERENGAILYSIVVSTRTKKPLHAAVFGASSGGKTSTVKTVLSLIPANAQLTLTSASPRSFEYIDEGLIRDKVVFIQEFDGVKEAAPTLRVVLTEESATRAVVQTDPKTKQLKTEIRVSHHRFSLVTTTTLEFIDPETENRVFCLHVDQSRRHLKEVAMKILDQFTLNHEQEIEEQQNVKLLHHAIYRMLKPIPVYIPYSRFIRFPHSQPRHQRDLKKFLNLIRAIAFIRQYQKEVRFHRGKEYVEADLEDYRIAYGLIRHALAEAFEELPLPTRETLKLAVQYINDVHRGSGHNADAQITTRAILKMAKHANVALGDQTKIGHILKTLEYLGYLESDSPVRQGSRRTYELAPGIGLDRSGELVGLSAPLFQEVSTPEDLKMHIEKNIAADIDADHKKEKIATSDDLVASVPGRHRDSEIPEITLPPVLIYDAPDLDFPED